MKLYDITKTHYAFIIVAACCLMMGINVGFTFSCAGIFYKPVTSALGISIGKFGLYMPMMYIGSALTLPFAGTLLERYSARLVFPLSSILNGLGLIGMGLSSSITGFLCAGFFLGVSMAFLLYMSFPTMLNRWFATHMGLMTGICCAASGLGGIIFNPIGAAIISSLGWRWGYFIFGGVLLFVVAPTLFRILRDYPSDLGLTRFGESLNHTEANGHGPRHYFSFNEIKRHPVFYALLLFAFLMMGCSTLNLFIPSFVKDSGFSLEQASLAASAAMLGVMLGKLMLGYINDRSILSGIYLSTIGGAIGLIMIFSFPAWLILIMAGSFLFGWSYAGVTVQTVMLTRLVAGGKDYARIYSYISIALSAGGAVASGGWGFLSDSFSYTFIFASGAALLCIATLLALYCLRVANNFSNICQSAPQS